MTHWEEFMEVIWESGWEVGQSGFSVGSEVATQTGIVGWSVWIED